MSRLLSLISLALTIGALSLATGCHPVQQPELQVLGVHDTGHQVVFVQVKNPADRPMRLTKLEYTFAADGATVSTGEVPLSRDVPAEGTVVVEVPLDADANKPMTLTGRVTAELDEIVQSFQVSAQIAPQP
jgi:LEA14-like dessication related protein